MLVKNKCHFNWINVTKMKWGCFKFKPNKIVSIMQPVFGFLLLNSCYVVLCCMLTCVYAFGSNTIGRHVMCCKILCDFQLQFHCQHTYTQIGTNAFVHWFVILVLVFPLRFHFKRNYFKSTLYTFKFNTNLVCCQ